MASSCNGKRATIPQVSICNALFAKNLPSGALSDFYARYREEQAYAPIDRVRVGVVAALSKRTYFQNDYSLYDLYDDERDDTYDDLEPGVADGDDPDRLLVQHRFDERKRFSLAHAHKMCRLNVPIEEEEENDEKEDAATKNTQPTSSAPTVRHHTTRNPGAYTGGRERQMKVSQVRCAH